MVTRPSLLLSCIYLITIGPRHWNLFQSSQNRKIQKWEIHQVLYIYIYIYFYKFEWKSFYFKLHFVCRYIQIVLQKLLMVKRGRTTRRWLLFVSFFEPEETVLESFSRRRWIPTFSKCCNNTAALSATVPRMWVRFQPGAWHVQKVHILMFNPGLFRSLEIHRRLIKAEGYVAY